MHIVFVQMRIINMTKEMRDARQILHFIEILIKTVSRYLSAFYYLSAKI